MGGPRDYVAPWVPQEKFESGIEVFSGREPDLEQILSLNPDLILVTEGNVDVKGAPSYAALSNIAPVVPVATSNITWQDSMRQVAEWLGRVPQYEAAIRDYEALRDEIKTRHGNRITSNEIVFGSYEAPATMWLVDFEYTEGPAVQALATLGGHIMATSVPRDDTFPGWRSFNMENARVMDGADAILVWAPTEAERDQLLADPLWPRLPAVQAGRAVISTNNVGTGSVYTVMECLRLWDEVYATFA